MTRRRIAIAIMCLIMLVSAYKIYEYDWAGVSADALSEAETHIALEHIALETQTEIRGTSDDDTEIESEEKEEAAAAKAAEEDPAEDEPEEKEAAEEETEEAAEEDAEEEIEIDIPDLGIDYGWFAEQNEDFLGILYIPAIVVSNSYQLTVEGVSGLLYPVVKSADNNEYLHTDFYTGSYSYRGTIFLDCASDADMRDRNSFIYGHNMRDLSCFGSLKKFLSDPSLASSSPYIYIYTEEKAFAYEIFACEVVSSSDEIYSSFYGDSISDELYDETVERLIAESAVECGAADIDWTARPSILTLSTCYGASGSGQRLIVCAALLN